MENEIKEIEHKMDGALASLEKRFATVRAGRANPSSLDGVMVEVLWYANSFKAIRNDLGAGRQSTFDQAF